MVWKVDLVLLAISWSPSFHDRSSEYSKELKEP